MKRWVFAVFVLLVLGSLNLFAVGEYGEKLTLQIFAKYRGELRYVIGADGNSPLILLEDGKTRKISPSANLGYVEKALPIAGKIEVLEYFIQRGDNLFRFKFIPEQDFDGLYFVVVQRQPKSSKIEAIIVKEIGSAQAGEITEAYFQIKRNPESRQPEIMFYHKGLQVKADLRGAKTSRGTNRARQR